MYQIGRKSYDTIRYEVTSLKNWVGRYLLVQTGKWVGLTFLRTLFISIVYIISIPLLNSLCSSYSCSNAWLIIAKVPPLFVCVCVCVCLHTYNLLCSFRDGYIFMQLGLVSWNWITHQEVCTWRKLILPVSAATDYFFNS